MKVIKIITLLAAPLFLSGCFVGETAALVVQTPFEIADLVIPGEIVTDLGESAAWVTDAVIPF
jgi:hypothetical protein